MNSSLNTQTCAYTAGTGTPAYGSLACAEKTYKTVIIGAQTWMAENLNFGTMVNGREESNYRSSDALAEKSCYDDEAANCVTDGGLYQWAEAMALPSSCSATICDSLISSDHHQGMCPTGWHIPDVGDWNALVQALGGDVSAVGAKMKLNNTGNAYWDANIYNDGNTSGFSALPVGSRDIGGGGLNRGDFACLWVATESGASNGIVRYLGKGTAYLGATDDYKRHWYSVRCVKDADSRS